jgi:hypothetical protein
MIIPMRCLNCKYYKTLTIDECRKFCAVCPVCQPKFNKSKWGLGVKK